MFIAACTNTVATIAVRVTAAVPKHGRLNTHPKAIAVSTGLNP